jgi:hypothetical protein
LSYEFTRNPEIPHKNLIQSTITGIRRRDVSFSESSMLRFPSTSLSNYAREDLISYDLLNTSAVNSGNRVLRFGMLPKITNVSCFTCNRIL